MFIFFINTFTIGLIVASCIVVAATSSTAASSIVAAAESIAVVGNIVVVAVVSIATAEMNGQMQKVVTENDLFGIRTCYYFNPFSSSRPNVKQGFSYAAPSFFCEYQNKACSCTL